MAQVSGSELWQWYQAAIYQSREVGIDPQEVDWLLQTVSQVDRLALRLGNLPHLIYLDRPWSVITALWQQRCQERQPIQYLVGSNAWRQFELQVSPAVLIPRPETELIVDLVLERLQPGQAAGHWADLGTGSGAIALGLAASMPEAQLHAVDCSESALAVASQNAQKYGLERINFYRGSWWEPLAHLRGQLTGMVSNPPYIPSAQIPQLQPEVVNWEPHLALDGGADGLDAIRVLVAQAPEFLMVNGLWIVEMMAGQGAAVVDLLERQGGYGSIEVIPDWAGLDRFVIARLQTPLGQTHPSWSPTRE
jgi:release factor glutamine methyltransferase